MMILVFDFLPEYPKPNSLIEFMNFFFYAFLSPSVAIEYLQSNFLIYIFPIVVSWTAMYFVMKRKEA